MQAELFAVYFGIGLLLMVVVFISKRATRGLNVSESLADGGYIAAAFLISVALLWPVWLVYLMFRENRGDGK